MRGLNVHKNIPVSITKLMLGLIIGFISSHLIADKLFPINPRTITGPPKMSLMLRPKIMPALIIKPRFIYPCFAHGWPWLVHNVQPAGKDVRSKHQQDYQRAKCYSKTVPVLHHKQYSNWFDVSGKLSYSHTSLELPEPSKWLPTERSDLSYLSVLQQQPVLSKEHQLSGGQVFHHGMGWADNQLIVT